MGEHHGSVGTIFWRRPLGGLRDGALVVGRIFENLRKIRKKIAKNILFSRILDLFIPSLAHRIPENYDGYS